jgi:hypothetical protein
VEAREARGESAEGAAEAVLTVEIGSFGTVVFLTSTGVTSGAEDEGTIASADGNREIFEG